MKLKVIALVGLFALFLGLVPVQAQTADVKAGVVGGTITAWDAKSMVVRGVDDEWTIYLDPHKTMMMGHPAVDSPVLVWFTRGDKGDFWATRVFVPQTEMWPVGTLLFPERGQVKGTIAKVDSTVLVIRSGENEWTFGLDSKKTKVVGTPAVDGTATVWYYNDGDSLYATKVQVGK